MVAWTGSLWDRGFSWTNTTVRIKTRARWMGRDSWDKESELLADSPAQTTHSGFLESSLLQKDPHFTRSDRQWLPRPPQCG